MDPEFANLIEHLDGLICMARATWQSSSEKYADIARTFRFVSRLHQTAALVQRDKLDSGLQITGDRSPK
jgi:hypothetical protein